MMNIIKACSCLFIALFTFSACTKTVDVDPLPTDRILEYKVSNLPPGESLYGAVDHNEKTITVYVPFYYALQLIDPEIKLSPGAKLADEIIPVSTSAQGHTYTVIGANGSRNSYTLRIEPQNTPPLEAVWGNSGYPRTQPLTYPLYLLPNINGNFYSNNPALVKVTLQSRNTKKEVVLNTLHTNTRLTPISDKINLYKLTNVPIPADIDTGYHDVKVDFLTYRVTLADPVKVQYRQPMINFSESKVVKQGDEITYPPVNTQLILDPIAVEVTANGKTYDFKILRHSQQSITLRVPDDFPVGAWRYPTVARYKGWRPQAATINLTISPK